MNFKDRLNLNWKHRLKTFRLRKRVKRLYNQQIKSDLEQLDFMQRTISETDKQISEWQTLKSDRTPSNINKNIHKYIDLVDAYAVYLKFECYLILLELDLYVAIKYLFIATDDWEVRFFARRCFTIMYEIEQSLGDASNKGLKNMRSIIDPETFKDFNVCKKKILKYLKPYSSYFKEIRNAGEAHKDADYNRLIRALESISIRKSYEIVFQFFILLLELSKQSLSVSNYLYSLYTNLMNSELKSLLDENP